MTSENLVRAPYPGLRSFRRSETELFFGRDGCINAMVDRLAESRFLAVLGSSGTGKSSLVKAGLLDALELGLMTRAGARWRIVDLRPEDAPRRNLARSLLQAVDPDRDHSDADIELLRNFLSRGPRSLVEWCRAGNLPAGENLLLLVDQFEELFRYQDYAGRDETEAFVSLLIESSRSKEFPIFVAITMRSEYLGACALINGLAEQINAGLYLAPRMTREQCRQAIVGPAKIFDIEIEDTLVNRLLNDLASFAPWEKVDQEEKKTQLDRLVRSADQLPLLQYTLNRMWLLARERTNGGAVKLRLADYKGLSFALDDHADQIFKQFAGESQAVEKIFRALTSGTSVANAVREPTRFDHLVALCDGDEATVRKIVSAYAAPGCNFLMPELDPAKPFTASSVIDISHESLIRQWARLSEWLTKESNAAQQWRRLSDRYNLGEPLRGRELANLVAWREEIKPNPAWAKRYGGDFPAVIAFLDKSDRAERARLWMRTGMVAATFAVLIVAATLTFIQWRKAEVSLARAESNYAIAKEVFKSLTFDIAGGLGSSTENQDEFQMRVTVVTDALRRAKETLDKLATANPDDLELEGVRALMLERFLDAFQTVGGYLELTLATALETNEAFRRLAAREPDNASWRRYLSVNLVKIGDLKLQFNDAPAARAGYDEALSLDRTLVAQEPENEDHPRRMGLLLVKIGDMQSKGEDLEGAGNSYAEALEITKKLAATYSILPIYRRDLSAVLGRVAALKAKAGDSKGALVVYREKADIDRALLEAALGFDEGDVDSLSSDLGNIADLQMALGDADAARTSYEERLRFDRHLARQNPYDVDRQSQMAHDAMIIGHLHLHAGDAAEAKKSYEIAWEARENAARITRDEFNKSDSAKNKAKLVSAHGTASWAALLNNRSQDALEFAELALRYDASQVWIEINRAHAYLVLGRFDDAKAIYLAKKDLSRPSDGTFADEIKDDFEILRRLAIAPDLERMAKELGI